jgi:cytochrome P450
MASQQFRRDMFDDFDIEDPEFNEKFYDVLDEFVSKCPVAHSTVGSGYHLINQYEDVKRAGQDWRTFSSAKGFAPNRDPQMPLLPPEECDPPYHNSWRTQLNPFFKPEAVAAYEDSIRQEANSLIDAFIDKGACDFVPEFSSRLPGNAMFKNLLGIKADDIPMLIEVMDAGFYGPIEERAGNLNTAFTYLGEYLARRKDEPSRGDIIDVIAAGVEKDGEPCPWSDRVGILTDLALGGIVTATFVMSGGMYHLATHPNDREALVSDPSLIPHAAEEFVRFYPPVVALGRSVTKDVEIGGYQFKTGDFVLLNYAAASRDPKAVENPGQLDIHRKRVPHSAFGVGVHRCIGAHLARLELKVTFEQFLRRIPDFRMKPGAEPLYETGILRSMKSLPLEFS